MSNHTPGPWKLKLGKGVEYTYQIKTDDVPIACFEHYTLMARRMDVLTLARVSRHKDLKLLIKCYYRESVDAISRRL